MFTSKTKAKTVYDGAAAARAYENGSVSAAGKSVRLFETGATRDTNEGKIEYARFLSPAAIKRYCQYMHEHRKQSDGALRDRRLG